MNVQVGDQNEFAPEWKEDSIRVTAQEGEMIDTIARLEAVDRDCQGKICEYLIESSGQPFEISSEGVLRNTRPLNYSESHSYVLSIVAADCSGMKSVPVLVIVEVKQPCHTGWSSKFTCQKQKLISLNLILKSLCSGLSSQINYVPSTGPQPLFPSAVFDLCPEDKCVAETIEATVHLETKHIGKGCDRDTYSLSSQRHLCGANEEAVDLLPEAETRGDLEGWNWDELRDKGRSSDQSITR